MSFPRTRVTPTEPPYVSFIPLRRRELIDLLCSEPDLPAADAGTFRAFCDLVTAHFHREYQAHAERLKDDYAPFDPDAATKRLERPEPEERQRRLDDLFGELTWMMERANFRRLDRAAVREALTGATDWGIDMDVDLGVFERCELFARGDVLGKRSRRRWWNPWRLEEVEVPVYQRLVLAMKLRPHPRLGPNVDTRNIHLKAFKDIPKLDLEMLLPGARVKFSMLDQGKITFPLLTAALLTLWTYLKPMVLALLVAYFSKEVADWLGANQQQRQGAGVAGFTLGLAAVLFGYGYRSWYSYQYTKAAYGLRLTESLYYQNLVNNEGVLVWLTDEAEEQECRETILGYWFLWRYAGEAGWTREDLDRKAEEFLLARADLAVDFEVGDALAKLERLVLVERVGDRYRAVPMDRAVAALGPG
jgi:hypothetical protein